MNSNIKPYFLFIHGYGSSGESRKYKNLKDYFGDRFEFDVLEWTPESNFEKLLKEKEEILKSQFMPIILGDSTGANLAYRLRQRLEQDNQASILIMTSPLLILEDRLREIAFSENLQSAIKKFAEPKDALIIATPNDEVLDLKWLFESEWEKVKLVEVDDSHRLLEFEKYLPFVERYLR